MAKWFNKKYAKQHAQKNPTYYKHKKLVKTTKLNMDREKRPAWKWK